MRLPDLTPADLDDEQRALYDDIVGGPRGSGPQHFALTTADGALTGPFGVMVHEPALGRPLQELGSAIRYATGLTDRVREIAILAVAAATGSAFEQHAHERVGRAVGLTDDELAALAAARSPRTTRSSRRRTTCAGGCWPAARASPTTEYADLVGALGTTTITELTVLVGYYRTLADLLAVFDVGVPADGSVVRGHHVLDARVVVEAVARQVLAVARVAEAAVRHLGDERDVGVDPHAPEVELARQPVGGAVVAGPDAGGEAVGHAVGQPRPPRPRRRTDCTVSTGPKTSSCTIRSSWRTPVTTVGAKK